MVLNNFPFVNFNRFENLSVHMEFNDNSLGGLVFKHEDNIQTEPRIIQIENIHDILAIINHLHGMRVICAFDWDNTISLRNGCNLPLREGRDTSETLQTLNNLGVMWFIATSRYSGFDFDTPPIKDLLNQNVGELTDSEQKRIFNQCVITGVHQKYIALPPLAHQAMVGYSGLNPQDVVSIRISDRGENPNNVLIYGNVIYSGGLGKDNSSNKGRAFVKLMANGILPSSNLFDAFIFVDNDIGHIQAVIDEFDSSGFGYKLLPIYYPQLPFTLPADRSCSNIFGISGCLIGK
jgi:hypothetical protein